MKNQGSGRQFFQAHKTSHKTPFKSGKHPGIATEQPPAVPLSGPNVTPEPNEKVKVLAGNSLFQGTESKPEDTIESGKHPGTPPAVPLPGPNVTPEPAGRQFHCFRRRNQATRHPSNQENTLARRDGTASCRPVAPNKKSKFWQAIPLFQGTNQATRHPSNQENTLARRDETASCPEPNEKIKGLAGNCSRHTKQATRHPSNQETPWHGVTKQPPAVLCPGQTSLLNRMKKSRVWQAIVPGTQNKPQDTLQIRKTPWHGVTKQPPAIPLPGPNVTPEPNEKIKGLAGNCSRHKTSHKTPFKSGKHPGTA